MSSAAELVDNRGQTFGAMTLKELENELECTHSVRTHVVLLCVPNLTITLTLTFDLSTPNHVTLEYPEVIPCTKFEHFEIIHF